MSGARPIGFAHRGARAEAPENTLAAFERALALGARGLESDSWVTRDGCVVLHHDGVDSSGHPFASLTRRELPADVPTLDDLYLALGCNFELSIDVKDARASELIAVARRHRALERLWLCHPSWRVVAGWRALSPAIRLVDSTRRGHLRTAPAPRAARMRALGIDAINLHESDWSADWIEAFRSERRAVLAWDAQDRARLDRALALGVDAVYSDHVGLMLEAIARAAGRAPATRALG